MDKKVTFIKTSDEGVATAHIEAGFKLIDHSNGIWTFLNDPTLKFDADTQDKVVFSNRLTF